MDFYLFNCASRKNKQGSVLTKLVKLAVASAVLFGSGVAMADVCGDGLGLQEDSTCCVYDANGDLLVGEISNISTDADGNITMKCYAANVEADKKATIFDSESEVEYTTCNTPTEYTRIVGKKGEKSFAATTTTSATDWQNVVSATDNDSEKGKGKATKTTNSSLVCEYVPLTPGEDTLSVKSVELK